MKAKIAFVLTGILMLTACDTISENRQPPTQVVYRFDDHRYLELTGFHCEGGLRYIDTVKNIHSVIYDISDGYRLFTKRFIHPSERYIVIPEYDDSSSFLISKDYGKTWQGASLSPGGGADPYGKRIPERTDSLGTTFVAGEITNPLYQDVVSLTVVNDQGFMQTKWGDIYISSKPFDDPRMQPGGTGIDYIIEGEPHHLSPRNNGTSDNSYWGKNYTSWASVNGPDAWLTFSEETNWQNIPNKVPEVKNYTGWDHMRCDPDAGLPEKEK